MLNKLKTPQQAFNWLNKKDWCRNHQPGLSDLPEKGKLKTHLYNNSDLRRVLLFGWYFGEFVKDVLRFAYPGASA